MFYTNYKGKLDYITLNGDSYNIGGDYMTDVVVPMGDWSADNTYPDFPYKAAISINYIHEVSDAVYEVVFDVPEAISGNYAPVCYFNSNASFLYIWAKEIPDHDITIPLIKQIL